MKKFEFLERNSFFYDKLVVDIRQRSRYVFEDGKYDVGQFVNDSIEILRKNEVSRKHIEKYLNSDF